MSYITALGTNEFLERTYILMRKNIKELKSINNAKKNDKLPFDLLERKIQITQNLLEVLKILSETVDYSTEVGQQLVGVYIDMSLMLSKANIGDTQHYDTIINILDGFLHNESML